MLAVFESAEHGRAALLHALKLAQTSGASLTVASVALEEDVRKGCAICRQGTDIWNRQMRRIALESLAEAKALVAQRADDLDVEFVVTRGEIAGAIAEAAERCGAEVIVLSWERSPRFGRLSGRTVAERLRSRGSWQIVVGPPSASV